MKDNKINKINSSEGCSPKLTKSSNNMGKDNKNDKHSSLVPLVSLLIICLGVILCYIGYQCHNSFLTKEDAKIPQNTEEVMGFLTSKSNFSEIVDEWKYDDFWPKEYFEISLKEKKISYWKDTVSYEVKYKDGSDYSLKEFENESSKAIFESFFPQEMGNLEDLIEETYRESINTTNIDENSKYLCVLYNALAGHPNSYVLLGRKSIHDNWMFFTPNDFPKYYLQMNSEHLMNYICKYANNKKRNPSECVPLNEAIRNNDVIDISAKALSFDRRKDIIWYGDSSKQAGRNDIAKLPAPYYYQTLNEVSASGWVVPENNNKRLEIFRAKNFYCQNDGKIYIHNETIENLNKLKWNENAEEPYWYYYCVIGGIVVTLLLNSISS